MMAPAIVPTALLTRIAATLERFRTAETQQGTVVTLAYAQSLDGCIAAATGATTLIGGSASRVLAHQLRAMHDGVLVGVETVLVDDPQLNVRHVAGPPPRPIVVDTRLRTPIAARLLQQHAPCIATTHDACAKRAAQLESRGAKVVRVRATAAGHVDLPELFQQLPRHGIHSVMVEGGGRIITSILQQRLARQLVVTIAAEYLGGVPAITDRGVPCGSLPRLRDPRWFALEDDMVLQGELPERETFPGEQRSVEQRM